MYGIIFNIFCYAIMTITMILVSHKIQLDFICQKTLTYKIRIGSALLLMTWAMFMTLYLIVDYDNIVAGPLNVRLNFFESITNIILPLFLIGSYFPEAIVKLLGNEKIL